MHKADNLTNQPVPLSRNLGTLNSWNPLGHSRPVTGLLYLYFLPNCAAPRLPNVNPLNAELNPICHLLALLGGATIVVVSRLRVKI